MFLKNVLFGEVWLLLYINGYVFVLKYVTTLNLLYLKVWNGF